VSVIAVGGKSPQIAEDAWVAPSAQVVADVRLGAGVSIWYTAVLRGDMDSITFGANSNFQDGCVAHTDPGYPVVVGRGVSVGHRAVLHGCTVEDDTLIGMGAVVLNGAVIGTGSLIAAGTVVLEGTVIPPKSLVAGVPGKVRRETTGDERAHIRANAEHYTELRDLHAAG
jgi:carbonic anhydrase/acetyltransferase-like protein (isoleucine patch superfamily)